MHLNKYEYCISPLLPFRNTHTHTRPQPPTQRLKQSTILHIHQVKPHRMKDSTPNPVTRKQIKGPLMLVATVTAVDLLQLPACYQSLVNKVSKSSSLTYPFSIVQENLTGHATRFDRLLDPCGSWWLDDHWSLSFATNATGFIPKSLEAMRLSGVLGLGNCGSCSQSRSKLTACKRTSRWERADFGLGGSARL